MNTRNWVLLRGLTRDARHWGPFVQQMRQHFADDDIVTPDMPGNGSLNRLTSPASVEQMCEVWRQMLLGQGLRPPFHLVAMSLGAMVATHWCDRYPDEIVRCVLINTSLRPYAPMHWRLRPQAWAPFATMLLHPSDAERAERTIQKLTLQRSDIAAQWLPQWVAWRRQLPVAPANALRQLLAAARYRAPRQAPRVSMLILNGARDALVDPRCSQVLAEAWGCPLRIHANAGHDLPMDDGAWVAQQVHAWVDTAA